MDVVLWNTKWDEKNVILLTNQYNLTRTCTLQWQVSKEIIQRISRTFLNPGQMEYQSQEFPPIRWLLWKKISRWRWFLEHWRVIHTTKLWRQMVFIVLIFLSSKLADISWRMASVVCCQNCIKEGDPARKSMLLLLPLFWKWIIWSEKISDLLA